MSDDGPLAKRQKLSEELSAEEVRLLKEAEKVQDDLDKINEEASDKILALEQEYNSKRKPVYAKRNAVLKSLPTFWKTALLHHPIFKRLISNEDAQVLDFLTEIDLQEADDIKSGFKMVFKFSENPFITNKELVKDISYDDEARATVHATPINWAPAKRNNKEFKENASFLSWVSDEDNDGSLAESFKDEVWPNPVRFFMGEVEAEHLNFDDIDEDEDEEDEDEGDTADEEDL